MPRKTVLSHPCLTSPVQFCLTFHDGNQQFTPILSLHHPAPEFPKTVLKLSDYISRPVVGETDAVQGKNMRAWKYVHFYFSTAPISLGNQQDTNMEMFKVLALNQKGMMKKEHTLM